MQTDLLEIKVLSLLLVLETFLHIQGKKKKKKRQLQPKNKRTKLKHHHQQKPKHLTLQD